MRNLNHLVYRLAGIVIVSVIGCGRPTDSGLTKGEASALGGAAIGTGLGAAVGSASGNAAQGAAIGGVAGGVTGAVVGTMQDPTLGQRPKAETEFLERQQQELERQEQDLEDLRRQEYHDRRLERALDRAHKKLAPAELPEQYNRY